MSLGLLIAVALPFLGPPSVTHSERKSEGAWTLVMVRNRFTGGTSCALKGRQMEVEGSALVLHFSKSVDTSDAWVRGSYGGEEQKTVIRRSFLRDSDRSSLGGL